MLELKLISDHSHTDTFSTTNNEPPPKHLHHWSWNFFYDMVQRSIWDFKNVLSYCLLSYLVTHRKASHPWGIEGYSLQRMNAWPWTALRVAAIRKVSKEPSSSIVWGRWCIQIFMCFGHLKRDATTKETRRRKTLGFWEILCSEARVRLWSWRFHVCEQRTSVNGHWITSL